MRIQVSEAAPDFNQWQPLLELLRSSFAFQVGRIDPPSSLVEFNAFSLEEKSLRERLFLAAAGGHLVGCAFARLEPDRVFVGKVAVALLHQRQGVGRRLLEAIEQFAKGAGVSFLELNTRIELVENQAAFSALGFVKASEHSHPGYARPTYITMHKQLVSSHASA